MIEIFTLPDCDECARVKVYLRENNIPFKEHDLKKPDNREARRVWRELGLNTAPVIVCTNKKEVLIFTALTVGAKLAFVDFKD